MPLPIGIDLGTTYSCVCVFDRGVQGIENSDSVFTTPSVVGFTAHDEVVGKAAYRNLDLRNTVYEVKRLIGKSFDDENVQNDQPSRSYTVTADAERRPLINVRKRGVDVKLTPAEVSAYVLLYMKKLADGRCQQDTKEAVITVPAYFDDAQREQTLLAGQLAGLEVLRIINEPTAAALAYCHQNDFRSGTLLVYDYGGGTFDVSVVRVVDGDEMEILGTAGDTHLGGADIDRKMMEYAAEEFLRKERVNLAGNREALARLRMECEQVKRGFAGADATATIVVEDIVTVGGASHTLEVDISRSNVESMAQEYIDRSLELVDEALREAKISKSDVNRIVLIGGTTKLKIVREELKRHFDGKRPSCDIDPLQAVAYGATLLAAKLSGVREDGVRMLRFNDMTPLNIGFEVEMGKMETIIPKNTRYGTAITEHFRAANENQPRLRFALYQGQRPLVRDNLHVGTLVVQVPAEKIDKSHVQVDLEVDKNGIIQLHVKDRNSDVSKRIRFDKCAVSQEEAQRRTAAAERYAEEDRTSLQRAEAYNELQRLLYQIRREIAGGTFHPRNGLTVDGALGRVNEMLRWTNERPSEAKETYEQKMNEARRWRAEEEPS